MPRAEIPESRVEGETSNCTITPEMFDHLELPIEIPHYEGTGPTSFKREHDTSKVSFIQSINAGLSGPFLNERGEVTDRAILGTTFKVLSDVLIIEELRRKGEDISEILPFINKKLENKRVAEEGERYLTKEGRRLSEYYTEHGFSGNPTLKVSRQELSIIINHIFTTLKTKPLVYSDEQIG